MHATFAVHLIVDFIISKLWLTIAVYETFFTLSRYGSRRPSYLAVIQFSIQEY